MRKEIKAFIVEDEELGIKNLIAKLKENCPQVDIVGSARNVQEALNMIHENEPELIFLDMQLGNRNGFELAGMIKHIDPEIIITSAYKEYAIEAFKFNVLYYLLKPIAREELVSAVQKAYEEISKKRKENSKEVFPVNPKKLFPIRNGGELKDKEDVIYCEGQNNRTIHHLIRDEVKYTSKTLGDAVEDYGEGFVRIHKSYVINLDYLEKYSREDGGYVILNRGKIRLPMSLKYFNELKEAIERRYNQ